MQILQSVRIWKQAPFLRPLLPFIAGILIENDFPIKIHLQILLLCLTLLFLIFCQLLSPAGLYGIGWISGITIHLGFFLFGCLLMNTHQDIQVGATNCSIKNKSAYLLIQILNDPVLNKKSYKCQALVKWLCTNQTCYHEHEKILIYIIKQESSMQVKAGSLLVIRNVLIPVENIKSIPDFDYKGHCRLRHIYAQVFLHAPDYAIIGKEKVHSIFTTLDTLRKKLLSIVKKYIPAKSENGLLEALMFGFTGDLDPELLKSYADAGVIHIIAISGLHLALIYHIIQIFLQRISKRKKARWFRLFLITGILWGYSLLSGASPSVIRSAMMFTLVMMAGNISREIVLYNTLAASSFLLICYDPFWIWDTGFQLSYAAVLSLRLFSKPVRELIPLQNKILSGIWDAASVSIAAQVLITPVSIFYFHRFPSYFLIANLVAVPLSSGILVGGIFLTSCSWIQPVGKWTGWLLGSGIGFLNGFIHRISQLPGAVISPLTLSMPQLILSYFIIFCFYHFLRGKGKSWLFTGLGAICLFQLSYFLK